MTSQDFALHLPNTVAASSRKPTGDLVVALAFVLFVSVAGVLVVATGASDPASQVLPPHPEHLAFFP
jgi:hypothetical protein